MLVQDQFEIEDGILKAYLGSSGDVRIPEGVHTIGEGVFKGMAWILRISLPASLKRIGSMAFKGCRQLGEINFPEGLLEVGEFAFHRCHKLEKLIFPKSMTKVGNCAFLYCDTLKKVVMEGPVRLEKQLFSHDLMLQEITLNKNVDDANFADEIFLGCVNIQRIALSEDSYEISNLIEVMNSHASYPKIIRSIAESVYHSMEIEDGILNKYSVNLKSIFLPEGITAIGKSCFYDKKGIVKIILPESLREIRANAFLNCISLEEITLQNEEVILDEKAFRGCCNLKKVHLRGTTYLLEEEVANELISRIRDQVLGDFYISGRVLVRYMGKEEQIQIPKGVEIIGERCFFGNEQLKTVLCPDSLLEIREQAFEGCVTLQNIVLSDKLRRIEREAFAECKKLLKCNLCDALEYIGEYAFRRCFLLKPGEYRPKNVQIHPYAFYQSKQFAEMSEGLRAEKLQKTKYGISVPEDALKREAGSIGSVVFSENQGEYIDSYAFAKNDKIKVLTITGVKRIGKYAFASCPNLEEVIIEAPECVIEKNAFSTCGSLKKVHLHVKEIGKAIFSYCRNLEKVGLYGVSVLPAESFAGCYSLQSFEANELTRMEERCFDECIHLNFFDFSGIKVIGDRAFERCDSLKKVELHKVECGYHAFADCASLESVEISQATILKSGAFIGCTQIKSIIYESRRYGFSKFSDSLNRTNNPYPIPVREVIASVYSCFIIKEGRILLNYTQDGVKVTIPQDVEEVGQDVFRDHIRLREIVIPASVKMFGSHAFSMTAWLEEQRKNTDMVIVNHILLDGASCKGKVVIPHGVKRIAGWCFAGNTDISELILPSDRIIIENLAFRNCLNLKKITDWNGNEYLLSDIADLTKKNFPDIIQRIFSECINCFKLDENKNLVESTGNIINLTFPDGIRSVREGVYKDCHLLENIALSKDTERIGKSAFENSKWLKSVTNAQAVAYIGAQAFSGCQSMESIELSDSLKEIGIRCFEHCASLKEIYLSDQLEKIPERAFFRCKSLTKLYIPKSVKLIENEAFAFCDRLEEVYIAEKTKVSDNVFAYCKNIKIHRYKPSK